MIRSLNELINYDVEELNAEKGTVKDFLFDKKYWIVRCLEIDMGFIQQVKAKIKKIRNKLLHYGIKN